MRKHFANIEGSKIGAPVVGPSTRPSRATATALPDVPVRPPALQRLTIGAVESSSSLSSSRSPVSSLNRLLANRRERPQSP